MAVFRHVGGNRPGRSVFNLSYDKKFDCDMGQLIPVMCDEAIPGDIWKIGNEVVVRFQPMIAPILHQVDVYVHYFFVPYRILWDDWEDFITGGADGDLAPDMPVFRAVSNPAYHGKGTLWDYFGFPVGVVPDENHSPSALPFRAYRDIYNEYYRDQNLTDEYTGTVYIKNRAWAKDYFTSALPWQQRGVAPALPISGTTFADFTSSTHLVGGTLNAEVNIRTSSGTVNPDLITAGSSTARDNMMAALSDNLVDLSSATTFNVADLRLAFQIQKWLERNARAGARYTEFLRSHFAVAPRDERLDRPEYIGGSRSPVIVSEVLQTSSTDATTPQGNLAGHGITADSNFAAKYRVQEFGIIMGIMSVMPKANYQQGIDRQWLRKTKYDFYFPEFANLSEQAIEQVEIYATDVESENATIFGYQGRYDEMRVKRNMVCNNMRDTLDYWHLGRQFASAPSLNEDFITCDPSKRIFAVQDEPGLIVNFHNRIKAIRPMPIMSNPGYIDH